MNQPRIFVDMDGCLAEWRNITLRITSEEQRYAVLQKMDELLKTPGYFRSLAPYENVVNAFKRLLFNYDVYSLSCVLEANAWCNPEQEKDDWLSEFIPNLPKDHRIFVPTGENKTDYVPGGVRPTDFLLDDFTKNLVDWQEAGGVGIKLLNNVNETHRSWKGSTISKDISPSQIQKDLSDLLDGRTNFIRHPSPKKDNIPLFEITESTVLETHIPKIIKPMKNKETILQEQEDDFTR